MRRARHAATGNVRRASHAATGNVAGRALPPNPLAQIAAVVDVWIYEGGIA